MSKMLFGSVDAFTIGLILLSFGTSLRGVPSTEPLDDQHVLVLEDPGNVSDAAETSQNVDSNEETPQHCDGTPKLMKIELSERLKNLKEDLSGNWNNYQIEGRKRWGKTRLTYSVHHYDKFPEHLVDQALKIAFSKWAAVTPLQFTQLINKAKTADMKIEFAIFRSKSGMHPTPAACSPGPDPSGIEIYFSLSIPWTIVDSHGPNASCVACHEIGHGLGLLHSENPSAIMHERADCEGKVHYSLHADDIAGIQRIYGKGKNKSGPLPGVYKGVPPRTNTGASPRTNTSASSGTNTGAPSRMRSGGWPEITAKHDPGGMIDDGGFSGGGPGLGSILGGILDGIGNLLGGGGYEEEEYPEGPMGGMMGGPMGGMRGGPIPGYPGGIPGYPGGIPGYPGAMPGYVGGGPVSVYGAQVKQGYDDSGDSSDTSSSSSDSDNEYGGRSVRWANHHKEKKSLGRRISKWFTSG